MCAKLWATDTGKDLVRQIFKALDNNDNGVIDEGEYTAATMHIATYIFCTKKGCPNANTHLDMLNESGYICPQCGPATVVCHEVSTPSNTQAAAAAQAASHHSNFLGYAVVARGGC